MFKGNRGFGGGFGGGEKQLFKATCAECGNIAEVPFKPNGSKPVYCRNCFKKDEGGFNDRGGSRSWSDRPSFEDRKMYQAVCDSCGNTAEVPFRPTGDRPIYCKGCFGANKGEGRGQAPQASIRTSDVTSEQLKAMNAKLDAIMKILAPSKASAPVAAPAAKAEAAPKEAKTEKKARAPKKAAAKKKK